MRLYRVLPHRRGARRAEPGHPLFRPVSTAGRIDNPDRYLALYFSDQAAGAVAEAFGVFGRWGDFLLDPPPAIPGATVSLVAFDLPDRAAVIDLDDPAELVARGLRPSQIVTRDRSVSQGWARALHDEGEWAGCRWWSYYDPRWATCGLWDYSGMRVAESVPLDGGHPAVAEASRVLLRPWGG